MPAPELLRLVLGCFGFFDVLGMPYPCGFALSVFTNHNFFTIKTQIIMKTRRTKAIIMAIATATGASVAHTNAAARAAMHDMQQEFGKGQVYAIEYDYNPFDGMIA